MNRTAVPVMKDLLLVGGGHSHVAVLKSFGMRPPPGVRLTLICKDVSTPYSGMLPGLVAGHYQFDEAHIDLRPLCRFAGAQFYRGTVAGLDLANKRVLCADRPPIHFDLLSINTGSTPQAHGIPGASKYALPVKPIDRFLEGWDSLVARVRENAANNWRIAVVGGGAGGVELTLCTQYRLRTVLEAQGTQAAKVKFHLVTDSPTVLPTHNVRVQEKFARILRERGVRLHLNHRVVAVEPGVLRCEPGDAVSYDIVLWVTNAAAPAWLAQSGLRVDANGFFALNDCLQSTSHPFVFGAGDVASVESHPRPKSGVFAVRQGRPLAENLRRALCGQPLRAFTPQREFLSLISTGDQYAVASRGRWALEGAWLWRLKNWIDRRWMKQYQELPDMESDAASVVEPAVAGAEALHSIQSPAMRCGGCGSKVGSTVLEHVLRRIEVTRRSDVLVGLESPDDAAVIQMPPGKAAVQTVDFFRSFIDDPYLFGRITANHCLGDVFAMGAEPQSALAVAVVPFAAEGAMEEQLYQLMSGAVAVLSEHNAALVGGHSTEGAELSFGLTVYGLVDPNRILRKSGMQPGDKLIFTKPLGIGVLFAAEMRRKARSRWIETALQSMLQSNREAAHCFRRHATNACTDVTGFGLIGHLAEMVKASGLNVDLFLDAVPLFDGALASTQAGIFSSLQPQNVRLRRAVKNSEAAAKDERYPLLFDPQTAGGLLASVPGDRAAACVDELKRGGYLRAGIIGEVTTPTGKEPPITIQLRSSG